MQKPDPVRLNAAIYPRTIEITTRFGDMDANHHLNNVAYARYFEEARVSFNRSLFLGPDGHRRPELENFRVLVAAIQIGYLREGHYGPPVQIGIGISRVGNNSFEMGAAAFQEGVCIATHDAVIATKASEGGLPAVLKETFKGWMLRVPGA
jgi:acyl-CoA thioester hydrolase